MPRRNVLVLVAIGVGADGYRRIPGAAEGHKDDKSGWGGFLRHLKERGLTGGQLIISDACPGLKESISDYCPECGGSAARGTQVRHFEADFGLKVSNLGGTARSKVREIIDTAETHCGQHRSLGHALAAWCRR